MSDEARGHKVDLVIVGAGWSGLYAAKYAKAEGLTVRVLEAREDLGGVWNYSESSDVITVMKSTISSSSRHVTEASDFGMPSDAGNFMRHQDVFDYLRNYAQHFDLMKDIRFNTRVVAARKNAAGDWLVTVDSGEEYRASRLVVCCGVHQRQRKISGPIASFSGKLFHSGDFKHFEDFDVGADDHVVVYGGGETASDIIEALVSKECGITWAIAGGQHFFRKAKLRPSQALGQYSRFDTALDEQCTPLHRLATDFENAKPGMRYACNVASSGSVLAHQGHGLRVWKNETPWFRQFFNKNGHVLEMVWTGRVQAAPEITGCEGQRLRFGDGSEVDATHVICCFGYEPDLSFLPESLKDTPSHLMYRLVFHPDDPTLSFIGYARPIILSIPLLAEVQCMWAAKVWSGKTALPDRQTMQKVAREDLADREAFFPSYSNKNIVHYHRYIRGVMASAGRSGPSYLSILLRNPGLFAKLLVTPYSPLFVRIAWLGQYSASEVARLEEYRFPTLYDRKRWRFLPYALATLLGIWFSRLLLIDDVFDFVAKRTLRRSASTMAGFAERYPQKISTSESADKPY